MFYARLHAHDASVRLVDLERWRAFRAMPSFDDGRAFRVAEEHDAIIGVLTLGKAKDPRVLGGIWRLRVLVDPEHQRQGLGTMLLRECEREASGAGASVLESFVDGQALAGRAFAAACGFTVFVHDLFLSRDMRPFDAVAPDGVRIRAYAPGTSDDATWAALCNATLVRDAGFVAETAISVRGYTQLSGF